MNHEKVDKVLDIADKVFRTLKGEKERLARADVERWRWDEPCITLIWTERVEDQYVGKNIHMLVVEGRAEIEVNAWLDKDNGERGEKRVRSWRHEYVDAVSILGLPQEKAVIEKTIREGYAKVSSWAIEDLCNQSILP
jgi:hypothetical protein